jgi:hypothetical protein
MLITLSESVPSESLIPHLIREQVGKHDQNRVSHSEGRPCCSSTGGLAMRVGSQRGLLRLGSSMSCVNEHPTKPGIARAGFAMRACARALMMARTQEVPPLGRGTGRCQGQPDSWMRSAHACREDDDGHLPGEKRRSLTVRFFSVGLGCITRVFVRCELLILLWIWIGGVTRLAMSSVTCALAVSRWRIGMRCSRRRTR